MAQARRILGCAAAAALLLPLTGCRGDDGDPAPDPVPAGLEAVGAGVGADPAFAKKLDARTASLPRPPAPGLRAASAAYEIDASAQPSTPVRISVPLARRPVDGDPLVALVADRAGGPWTPVAARATPDGRHAEFRTPHFSFFWVGSVNVDGALDEIRDLVDGATSGVTAEAEQPRCPDEDGARTEGFAVRSEGPDTLKWCFGRERDGRRILRVANARRYYLMLQHPGARTVEKPSSAFLDPDRLAGYVDRSRTALPPRGQVTYSVAGPARVRSAFDGFAQSLFALEMGMELAVSFRTKFGGDRASAREKLLAAVYDSQKCARRLGDPGNGGAVLADCLGIDTLGDAFGAKGVLIGTFMAGGAVAEFFRSELNALGDQFNGRDRYAIRVTRVQPPVLGVADLFPNGDGWGAVAPDTIFNGGVPNGLATDIGWTGWGTETARGRGRNSIYMPEGGYYPERVPIEFEATRLRSCDGGDSPAYTRLRARVPDAPGEPPGDWFLWTLDLCDADARAQACGQDAGTPNTDDVTTDITAWDTDCGTARALARAVSDIDISVAGEPDDLRTEADGFVCGGYLFEGDGLPYVSWQCLRGTASVTFEDY